MAETTPDEEFEIPITPVIGDDEDSEIAEDNIDLKPYALAEKIKSQRQIALGPDMSDAAADNALSLPEIVTRHSRSLGLSSEQFERAAQNQGLDIGVMVDGIGRQGREVKDVFKELKDSGTVAFDPLDSRVDKMKEFRRSRRVLSRGEDIKSAAKKRIKADLKQFDFSPAELASVRPEKEYDFKKIRDPSKRQAAVAEIVYDIGSDAELSKNQMVAILANGLAESRLDPFGKNQSKDEDSHGVWQFNRSGSGEGAGFTVEQLQDPKFQMQQIVKATKDRDELSGFRDKNADVNQLTEQFMVKFEKPARKPGDVQARQAYIKQAQRLIDAASKESPKSKNLAQLNKEKGEEVLRILEQGVRGRYKLLSDREAAGGKVENEVVKPGSKEFEKIQLDVAKRTIPEFSDDPERARMIQQLLAKYEVDDSGDQLREVFADQAFQDIYTKGVNYDLQLAANKLGVDINEFVAKANVVGSKENKIRTEIWVQNRNDYAKYLTSGKIGVPAFMSFELMDPENYMQEDRLGPGDPYASRVFDAASKNRVQMVGLDRNNVPVFRGQGDLESVLDKLDLHLSMSAGAIKRLARGPEGESIMQALQEGSIQGIKDADNYMKLLMSTEGARSSDAKAAAYGMVGLLIDVLAPDPTIGLAKVASSTRKGVKAIKPILDRKKLPQTLNNMETAAEQMIESEMLISRASEQFAAGNIEEGNRILDEAFEVAVKAETAERAVRKDLKGVMNEVDRTDSNLAREISRDVPMLVGKGADNLQKSLSFSDFGVRRDFVHPSFERVAAREGGEDQIVKIKEFFDLSKKIERLKDTATKIQNNEVGRGYTQEVLSKSITPLERMTAIVLKDRGFTRAKAKDQPEEVTTAVNNLFDFFGSVRAAEMAAESPDQFKQQIGNLISNIPTQRRGKAVMDVLDEDIDKAIKSAQKIASATDAARESVDLTQELTDVTKSLAAIAEARGAAHAFVRSAVAKQEKVNVTPVIKDVMTRYDEVGNDKISTVALDFRNELETAFPALKGDPAMHVARNLDERLKAISRSTNENVELIYETRDFKNIIPNLKRKMMGDVDDVQTTKLIDEDGSNFGEELLTSKEIRDVFDDPTDLFVGLVVRPKDGTLEVRSIELPKALQKKGIATKLYKSALKRAKDEGLDFTSDINPSADAQRIYERLMNEGIPIKSETFRSESGQFITQFKISNDALKDVPDSLFRAGDDVADDITRYEELWLPDFVEDAQKTVRAMEEAPTLEDFMLEINKISRLELDADQMSAVTKWLSSKGINVGHRGARFISDDAAAVEQAEEAFAKAFSSYAKGRPPPTTETTSAFERVKRSLVNRFASAKNAAADGARFEPTSEIEKVFNSLLLAEEPRKVAAPNLFRAFKRAIVDDLPKNATQEYLLRISKESDRLGTPISVKELRKKLAEATEKQRKNPEADVRIELPGPVSLGGLISPTDAKSSYTLLEFGRGALSYAARKDLVDSPATRKIALDSQVDAIQELTPTQLLDQYLSRSRWPQRWASRAYIGGDAVADMRDLPPKVRQAIMAGTRATQQAIGDAVGLISDGDFKNLVRYMTGDPLVKFKNGRQVFSSGHDMSSDAMETFSTYIKNFELEFTAEFNTLLSYFKGNVGRKVFSAPAEDVAKAARKFILNNKGNRLLQDIFKSLDKPDVLTGPGTTIQPKHLEILENIFYLTGNAERNGKRFSGSSVDQFKDFYGQFNRMYKWEKYGDPPVANRITVLMAAHGQAAKARKDWIGLGIVVDARTATNFKKWIVGEGLDSAEDLAKVQQAFQVHGYNPQFLNASQLEDLTFYVPRQAREKLSMALEQAVDPTMQLKGDLLDAIGRGIRESESGSQLAMAFTARYLKTKMVRGHFLLKSRYFWMNTMDHFNQMAQIVGFRPAFISTARLIPQTFATNPIFQTALLGIQRAGKDDVGEVLRASLSKAGDKGAEWAAGLTRASKWNGSLDDLLEGRDGFVMVDDVPVSYRDLRAIGVEEGLAASFQTAELGTKIRRQGEMFLEQAKKKQGLAVVPLAPLARDIYKIAEDLAEGWSERERFGAMLTLVEMGVEPRKAARLSIDALYDYAGTMSKADRHWLINIFFPFWAFQKNANRQLIDVLFSPRGAYRLGVLRRGYERVGDYASELLYEDIVDPLGLSTELMTTGEGGELDQYESLKAALAEEYGKPIALLPDNLKRQIRLAFTGRDAVFEDGKWYQIDAEGRRLRASERFKQFKNRFPDAFVEKPSRVSMARYTMNRDVSMMPYPTTQQNKNFHDLMSYKNPNRTFSTFMFPEQSYRAAGKDLVLKLGAMFAIARRVRDLGPAYYSDADDGGDLFTVQYPFLEIFQPERALLASDLAVAFGLNEAAAPYKLSPFMAKGLDYIDVEILPVDPKEDPISARLANDELRRKLAAGEIQSIPEDPYLNGEILVPTNNYYVSGGMPSLILRHGVPAFDELNTIMKKFELTPQEEHAKLRGQIQRALRSAGIIDTMDVNPQKTARGEMYEQPKESGAKSYKEFKSRQGISYLDDELFSDEKPEIDKVLDELKKSDPGDMEIDLE